MYSVYRRSIVLLPAILCLLVWFTPYVHAGAVTNVTITQQTKFMNRTVLFGTCKLSTSYASGGDTLSAAQLGLSQLENVIVLNSQASGYQVGFNGVTSNAAKLQVYVPSGTGTISWGSAPTNTAIGFASQQDVFPYTKASKAPADDVAGSALYSDITGGGSLLGANYAYVVTSAVPSNGVTLTIAAQPDVPRNVNICCHNINGGTVANAATSYLITGTFNGAAQTETIAIPAVSMADGACIYKSGAKPFDTIASIVPTITGGTEVAGFQVIAGIGSKIGLSRLLYTPAEADVKIVTKTGAPVAISSITTATAGSECVNFGTIAANDYLVVKYKTKAYTTTPTITLGTVPTIASAITQASGNLATTPGTIYYMAIGY